MTKTGGDVASCMALGAYLNGTLYLFSLGVRGLKTRGHRGRTVAIRRPTHRGCGAVNRGNGDQHIATATNESRWWGLWRWGLRYHNRVSTTHYRFCYNRYPTQLVPTAPPVWG